MRKDDEILKSLGISDGKRFGIVELKGIYIYNREKQVICVLKGYHTYIVKGLYESVLKGKYHVQAIK